MNALFRDRSERDQARLKLLLLLVRNILAIQDPQSSAAGSSENHWKSTLQVIWSEYLTEFKLLLGETYITITTDRIFAIAFISRRIYCRS